MGSREEPTIMLLNGQIIKLTSNDLWLFPHINASLPSPKKLPSTVGGKKHNNLKLNKVQIIRNCKMLSLNRNHISHVTSRLGDHWIRGADGE